MPRLLAIAALLLVILSPTPAAATVATQGYWLVASDGGVFSFGGAPFEGSAGSMKLPAPIVGMAGTPSGRGYWMLGSDGAVYAFGDATSFGSAPAPAAAIAATPDGAGYWVATKPGRVLSFGRAPSFPMAAIFTSPSPIVAIAPTSDGGGFWLASSNGGVYSFGDAPFFGSAGALPLAKPIVGMAVTPSGNGYWLVASDGGIFSYGDAAFYGSTGNIRLNKPVVGMAATGSGGGYWLVASDGGIFAYGDAPFRGSTGNIRLNKPIVAMLPSRVADPYPVGQQGYDISFPQCGQAYPSPPFALGVVGVNHGRAFTSNQCLTDEAAWAGSSLSVYMNLNAPTGPDGPGAGQGLSGPAGNCVATDAACIAYNFGFNAAGRSYADAAAAGIHSGVWWLDIETSNTWDSSTHNNALTIQGALNALTAQGVIAGSYAPQTPLWVATGGDIEAARADCAPDHAFGGGTPWLTQFGTQGVAFDQDYACPVT